MTEPFSPDRPVAVDLRALCHEANGWAGSVPLTALERLSADLPTLPGAPAATPLQWQARAEWRDPLPELTSSAASQAGGQAQPQLWLHLQVQASLAQTCQRCLQPFVHSAAVDRWFRFVKDEASAAAQDESSEEDVLVFAPRFNLLELIEDEILMALPLVPMHEVCPDPLHPPPEADSAPVQADAEPQRPHPFAALAALKSGAAARGQGK